MLLANKPLIPDQDAIQGHGVDLQKYAFSSSVCLQSKASSDCTIIKHTINCRLIILLLDIQCSK